MLWNAPYLGLTTIPLPVLSMLFPCEDRREEKQPQDQGKSNMYSELIKPMLHFKISFIIFSSQVL